jgi:hypothetical protein
MLLTRCVAHLDRLAREFTILAGVVTLAAE